MKVVFYVAMLMAVQSSCVWANNETHDPVDPSDGQRAEEVVPEVSTPENDQK